ncbi:MAG: signal recognition particle receptor subunit alpha, partial [Bacteroidota bacterium]
MGLFSFFTKEKKQDLNDGLQKTRDNFFTRITKAVVGKSKVDEEVLDDIEEALVASDVGVSTTVKIIDRLEARVAKDKYLGAEQLNTILKEEVRALLSENNTKDLADFVDGINQKPYV